MLLFQVNHAKIDSMDNPTHQPLDERNPITHMRHRKEALWQITIPIAVGGLILLALSLLSTRMVPDEASRWADISLIWMIMPAMVVTLLSLVTLIMSIYATVKLIQVLPFYAFRFHRSLMLIGAYLYNTSDRIVEPFLRAKSFTASAKTLRQQIFRNKSKEGQV